MLFNKFETWQSCFLASNWSENQSEKKILESVTKGNALQVLTHAARAAAKQLNKAPLVAARGAREGLWSE